MFNINTKACNFLSTISHLHSLSFSFIHIFFYPRIEHLDHHFKIQNKCTEFIWFNFNETLIAMNEVE